MKGEIRDEGCGLKTLVCFALKVEAAPFRKVRHGFHRLAQISNS
jgi:hypothetical protein